LDKERQLRKSGKKISKSAKRKQSEKFDDFFDFDPSEDFRSEHVKRRELRRIEHLAQQMDRGGVVGSEDSFDEYDSEGSSSEEEALMVDIDIAQQRAIEKKYKTRSIKEEAMNEKRLKESQAILGRKTKNAEYYANVKEVSLPNAQLSDRFIEEFSKFFRKFEEDYEKEKNQKLEEKALPSSRKEGEEGGTPPKSQRSISPGPYMSPPGSPKMRRQRAKSKTRKDFKTISKNFSNEHTTDSSGDDDAENDIFIIRKKYSPVASIDLSGNRFSKLGNAALFKSLSPNVHTLMYNDNDLSHSIDSLTHYLSSVNRCRLKTLNLSNTKLGNPNLVKLCNAMSHNPHVTSLDVSNNNINTQGCTALAVMLERVEGVVNLR